MAQESWNCDTAEGSGCQQQEGLVQCTNNCGLVGCAATMNLCSRCFRELALKKQGSSTFSANTSEKVAAVIGASAEKSLALSEKTLISTTPMEKSIMSAVGSDKPFATSVFTLPSSTSIGTSDLPDALPSPVTVETAADAVDLVLSLASASPAHTGPSHVVSSVDLAPIAALLTPDFPNVQPTARGRSTNRCLTCKKRMGLLGFKCRCGNIFCAMHRYSDKHACPFDYKAAGKEAIAKANPIVKAQKVERI